jgi:ubiquinol-cytochrome c reductase iron-sulfur subunit
MAPLTNATRVCLRASKATAVRAAALSTTAATRGDSAASYTQYSSPFKQGGSKGSKIPDFGKYVSKNAGDSNKLVSYFMVGAMGAITAAGAKSTVQGMLYHHHQPTCERASH